MGGVAQFFGRAVGWHRQALAFLLDTEVELRALESDEFSAATADVKQRRRVARLNSLAQSGLRGCGAGWVPGWTGRRWTCRWARTLYRTGRCPCGSVTPNRRRTRSSGRGPVRRTGL